MKGVVFNILEDFVVDGWGEEAYEDILDLCPLQTKEPFVGPGTYPDSDLFSLAGVAAERLGVPFDRALVAFGEYMFPRLAEKVPALVARHSEAKPFLMSVDTVIHVEVKKLFPKARTPRFFCDDLGHQMLGIRYESSRDLCQLMEGLLKGVGAHFRTELLYEQTRCVHRGDEACYFEIEFRPADEEAA